MLLLLFPKLKSKKVDLDAKKIKSILSFINTHFPLELSQTHYQNFYLSKVKSEIMLMTCFQLNSTLIAIMTNNQGLIRDSKSNFKNSPTNYFSLNVDVIVYALFYGVGEGYLISPDKSHRVILD